MGGVFTAGLGLVTCEKSGVQKAILRAEWRSGSPDSSHRQCCEEGGGVEQK